MATIPSIPLGDDHQIPIVGYGTFLSTDENQLEIALNAALENGYRHIDTAYVYQNEHVIGRVIKKWIESGKLRRDELFITTKLPRMGNQPDRVEQYLKESLERLQLDYIDLYLIHFPISTKPQSSKAGYIAKVEPELTDHVALWKKLEEQVDIGRTKTIGLSNFNIKQIGRILQNCRIKPACLQVEINVFLPEFELVQYAQKNGLVVVAFAPLLNPNISTFYTKFNFPQKKLPTMFAEPIKSIATKHKKSPAQIMLKYLLQRKIVVIPKTVTVERVKENIDLFDFELDANDLDQLRQAAIGEAARSYDFGFSKEMVEHPEYPFAGKRKWVGEGKETALI